eukprot:1149416-Pelagomonas_calceolata.AAC.2
MAVAMKREQSIRSTRVFCLDHSAPGKGMPQGAAMIVGLRKRLQNCCRKLELSAVTVIQHDRITASPLIKKAKLMQKVNKLLIWLSTLYNHKHAACFKRSTSLVCECHHMDSALHLLKGCQCPATRNMVTERHNIASRMIL